MERLKVLMIPAWYPEVDNPFRGIFFKMQAEALNTYVDVAVLHISQIQLNQPIRILNQKNNVIYTENKLFTCKCKYVNYFPKLHFLSTPFFEKKIIEGYSLIIDNWGKPDIIHAHVSYPAGYAAMLLCEKYKIPFIVSEHASFFEEKLMTTYKKYTTKVLKNANCYTAVSSDLRRKIRTAGREQCEIIPNFIGSEYFEEFIEQKEVPYKFELIHIANRMRDVKGIDLLLYSLHRLIYKYGHSNVHLNLVGGGKEKSKYEKLAIELELDNYCTFHGNLNYKGIVERLKLSNILIVPSRTETFGITAIEGMSMGLPVVATKCGGPEDYITNDVGILVEKENVESLTEGIISMIENYAYYDFEKIRHYAKSNYSEKVVCNKIITHYMKILDN